MSLSFITDSDLKSIVKDVIQKSLDKNKNSEKDLYKNVVDPFSAIFDSLLKNIHLSQWLYLEASRQQQKTLQNSIGNFHERVIGAVVGWENLAVGQVVDIVNHEKKIIAEIKNKHNTTKGNHKKDIYDDIDNVLASHYMGYTGYYVEILPKKKDPYDIPFTPPDNVTHTNRTERDDIRVIDGKSFYEIVTGSKSAIIDLYKYLPDIIFDSLRELKKVESINDMTSEKEFTDLIGRVFEL